MLGGKRTVMPGVIYWGLGTKDINPQMFGRPNFRWAADESPFIIKSWEWVTFAGQRTFVGRGGGDESWGWPTYFGLLARVTGQLKVGQGKLFSDSYFYFFRNMSATGWSG